MITIEENMNSKYKDSYFLIALIFVLFILNYSFIDRELINFFNSEEEIFVDRIIDGDTIESNHTSIRLLGINAPEKGELYSEEAKEFLGSEILNKTVVLKFNKEREDLYGRTLAYIFLDNQNINLKLVENGLANPYFPSGKDKYYNSFANAWKSCINKDLNLCKKSTDDCSSCIKLNELNAKEDKIVLYNSCDFSCKITNWTIKDEGRKKFVFPEFNLNADKEVIILIGDGTNSDSKLYWKNETYVLTSTGDTIFLRDDAGGLVLWKNY